MAEAARRRVGTLGVVSIVALAVVLGLVLVLVAGVLIGIVVAVLLGAVGALGWMAWVGASFAAARERVVSGLGRPAGDDEMPRMRNALEGVAILTGVAVPDLRVLERDCANALVACGQESSTVVVTSGLMQGCGAVEAEALAAWLLGTVRDGSAQCATLGAALPPVLARLAALDAGSLARLLGAQRAVVADAAAVSITRYPPGLVAALQRMGRIGTTVPGIDAATAALWLAPAVGVSEGVDEQLDATVNQPLDYRVAVLSEL